MPKKRKGGCLSRQTPKAKKEKVRRENESDEQWKERLSAMARAQAKRLATETPSQKVERLSDKCSDRAKRLSTEKPSEKKRRLSTDASAHAKRVKLENLDQRNQRLLSLQLSKHRMRQSNARGERLNRRNQHIQNDLHHRNSR